MTREETVMDIFRNFLAEAKCEWIEQGRMTFRGMIGGDSGRWGWLAHCHIPADLEAAWVEWSRGVQKVDVRGMALLRAAFEAGAEAAIAK